MITHLSIRLLETDRGWGGHIYEDTVGDTPFVLQHRISGATKGSARSRAQQCSLLTSRLFELDKHCQEVEVRSGVHASEPKTVEAFVERSLFEALKNNT